MLLAKIPSSILNAYPPQLVDLDEFGALFNCIEQTRIEGQFCNSKIPTKSIRTNVRLSFPAVPKCVPICFVQTPALMPTASSKIPKVKIQTNVRLSFSRMSSGLDAHRRHRPRSQPPVLPEIPRTQTDPTGPKPTTQHEP